MDITVSIVIPVYNVVSYIDQCIESVVNQSYEDIEIILVNDGSTDGSEKKCLEWKKKDSRIILINKVNEGLGSSRNIGIQATSGKYIAFLDSDDWLDRSFIEKMLKMALRTNADMTFCDYYKVDNVTGNKISFITKLYTEEVTSLQEQPQLLYGADVAMWIKLYKTQIFIENEIVIPDIPYEDTATYAVIAASCKRIAHLKEKLLYYRVNRHGSILDKHENRKLAIQALQFVCDEMKARNFFDKYMKQIERFCVRFISYTNRELKQLDNADSQIEGLKQFLNVYFPNWKIPYAQRFCTIGSNNLFCIVNQIPYDIDNVYKFTAQEFITKYKNNIEELEKFDYFVVDVQPNGLDQSIQINDYRKVFSIIKNVNGAIILVKNTLAEKNGEYLPEKDFLNVCSIRIVNQKIDMIYQMLVDEYHKIDVIERNMDETYFADKYSRHGCSPYHMNDMYFTEMADKIIEIIRREKYD